MTSYVQARCPHCNRLAAEAACGSQLRVKCVRCRGIFLKAGGRPEQ